MKCLVFKLWHLHVYQCYRFMCGRSVHVLCDIWVFMWCVTSECSCAVWHRSVHVLCDIGVFMWCVTSEECSCAVWHRSVHVLCDIGVFMWCVTSFSCSAKLCGCVYVKVKVNQSHYRSGGAQRVAGSKDSQISWQRYRMVVRQRSTGRTPLDGHSQQHTLT